MAKLGFFDILKVFACTIREGRPCFDWYLEASKAGNDRVTSLQQINKKCLKLSELKRLPLPGRRSSGTGKSRSAFMPFGFWFLGISLPFVSECDYWLVKFWFGLVWVCRHLVNTSRANMGIAHFKVPHSTWEPLGKTDFFFWLVNL